METWAIIPIKHLKEAKSSLSSVMNPLQRQEFVLRMLTDILRAVEISDSVAGSIVVSPDSRVLEFSQPFGATIIRDPGKGLNHALDLAVKKVKEIGGKAALIMPGDVPLVTPREIDEVVGLASREHEVIIAKSNRKGTNAMLLKPPDAIKLKFGGESFPLHVEEASLAGINPRVYESLRLATDIDEVSDLAKVKKLGGGTKSWEFIKSLDNSQ